MSDVNPTPISAESDPDDLPVFVLDSFAVLAYLFGEPAGKRVQEIFDEAKSGKCRLVLPIINLGEILYITERLHGITQARVILGLLEQEPLEIYPAERATVLAAAHIKANYLISYADAFVVSIAQALNGVILTGDREFHSVENFVKIDWLPQKTSK